MDLKDLAKYNRRQILRLILKTGGISRTEVARVTGISHGSLTEIVNKLIKRGIVAESRQASTNKKGRPRSVLKLDPERLLIVVAGDHPDGVVAQTVTPNGSVINEYIKEISSKSSFNNFISALKAVLRKALKKDDKNIQAIVIRGMGVIDSQKGFLVLCTKERLRKWKNKDLLGHFRKFDKSLFLQNGSHLRAFAENWYGAAQDIDDFLYFHLDSGIGGAIILDGIIVEGPSHGAGEFGHIIADVEGPVCCCGNKGCIEAVSSMIAIGNAIGKEGNWKFANAWKLYEQGHKGARIIIERAITALAQGIVSAAVSTGPNTILLGGRMVEQSESKIVGLINQKVSNYKIFEGKLDIRKCILEEDRSEVLGAVAYALQNMDI